MTKTAELLPCPFCGSQSNSASHASSYVMCFGCDADGPIAKPGQNAVVLWNTRAAPADNVRAVVERPVYQVCNGVGGWVDVDLLRHTACQLDPEEYLTRVLFTHPQRPVVLPERRQKTELGIYSLEDEGYNACLDDIARLNP